MRRPSRRGSAAVGASVCLRPFASHFCIDVVIGHGLVLFSGSYAYTVETLSICKGAAKLSFCSPRIFLLCMYAASAIVISAAARQSFLTFANRGRAAAPIKVQTAFYPPHSDHVTLLHYLHYYCVLYYCSVSLLRYRCRSRP